MKVFSPAKVLKEMDLLSGSLNLQGIKILYSVESRHKKYFVSVIPSSRKIKEIGKELARYGDEIIPFKIFETSNGEDIEFDYMRMFSVLLHTYSLIEKAKRVKIPSP